MGHGVVVTQDRLEGQLCLLEFQLRLLHADGRQQNEVCCSGTTPFPVSVEGGVVVDRPGILTSAGA